MKSLDSIWRSRSRSLWSQALATYDGRVQAYQSDLDKKLDPLDLGRIKRLRAREWYLFLRDEYFKWKYTGANRYASTTKQLALHEQLGELPYLLDIKRDLLALDVEDVRGALEAATRIRGLGVPGAS